MALDLEIIFYLLFAMCNMTELFFATFIEGVWQQKMKYDNTKCLQCTNFLTTQIHQIKEKKITFEFIFFEIDRKSFVRILEIVTGFEY